MSKTSPFYRALCAASFLLAYPLSVSARAEQQAIGYADRVARLLPAVVAIETVASAGQGQAYFYGSGFIIDPSGIIVTNRHVIAGAFEINAIIPGIGRVKAKPMFVAGVIDLALLKVDVGQPLPVLHLGDSRKVRIGDEVLLLGNPLDVGVSVTHGIISGLNRDIGESIYDHFFQTDAPLNHGNSGGPMVDMNGEVIGINTGLTSSPGNTGSVGIGYAMPTEDAEFVINQLLHTGRVLSGTSGVQAEHVTDELAEAFGLQHARGSIVTAIDPAGPAAGHLEVGDIILDVNGQDASDGHAIVRMIGVSRPGTVLHTKFIRRGVEMNTDIKVMLIQTTNPKATVAWLGHAPGDAISFASPADPGMTLEKLTPDLRRRFSIDSKVQGVAVTAVETRGAAAQHRIVAGDVILAVGEAKVSSPEDVTREMRQAVAQQRRYVPLLVFGESRPHWVPLPVQADR